MNKLNPHTPKLLALGFFLLPVAGFAADANDDLSYGYVEADYINLDVDQPGEDFNVFKSDFDNGGGYGISASFPITDAFFVFGDYSKTEADFSFTDNANALVPGNTDLKRLNLGAGFVLPMSDSADMVFSGAYSDIDYNNFRFGASSSNSIDDLDDDPSDGYFVDAKFRSQLSTALEGSIGARYTDIESAEGFSVIGNLMYEFAPNWGLNFSLDAGDDLFTWGAGVRFIF